MGRPPRNTEAFDVGQNDPLTLSEIGDPPPIEKVSESDFSSAAKLSAFMNEILTVVVADDAGENSIEVPCVNVNGLNQAFIRGQVQKVKRKYVEQLARTRVTKYEQKTPDPSKPENIQMVEKTALKYPFTVMFDPSPNGREWLQAILKQPV